MAPQFPGEPPRILGQGTPYLSPGARKEKLRERHFRPRAGGSPHRYAELHAASAFSFLDGASLPEDLVERAAALGLPAVALLDRNGVYGAPRFHQAAKRAGIKALVGAEVVLELPAERTPPAGREDPRRSLTHPRLPLLVADRTGYRNLCRMLSTAARGATKGEGVVGPELLAAHAGGLWALTGGTEGPVARALAAEGIDGARRALEQLAWTFEGRVRVELQRHGMRDEEHRNQALLELARRLRLPIVATNGVRYATPDAKPLHDVLTALRHRTTLDQAGRRLEENGERHLKAAGEMASLFVDLPAALAASAELAERLDFTLADLGYRFPDYPLPPGETPASYLRQVTWNAARSRFRPLSARAQAQIAKELALIEKLDLAGYFLIVWDLVQFCQRERILAQGRGSAANSAVCYALGITAVDPVKMDLLFERFLSEERGEWPDIDLDLPSGEKRERVIQYVYRRYGPQGTAMTANVITYRDRSATREVAKVLGFSSEQIDRLAKQLGTFRHDTSRGDAKDLDRELAAAGLDPTEPRVRHFATLWKRIHNLPRHLGQHSGGMVIAAGRLDEVVPLEPAAMPGRLVVQWDKDDCADLGIIKVDLLGLGMLNALEEAIPLIRVHERVNVDLAHLPQDDPGVFAMLRAADTVGVFQVESRAQMASLPRNAPEKFYDLVIQVAIIRPGPIVGGMVRPFFERRLKRQPVVHLHPSLAPILERTLGVPLFQEQLLRIAMVAAGFSGGEAEELRRAMGFKRSEERMRGIEAKLRAGMTARGITGETQNQIVQSITSFALYGFPESHAASFALIAYASAYLKRYHPTAFLIALLNAWPMGFYHPATLVQDAMRHGVAVLPIDVNFSDSKCLWEIPAIAPPPAGERVLSGPHPTSVLARDTSPGSRPPAGSGLRAGAGALGPATHSPSGPPPEGDLTERARFEERGRGEPRTGPAPAAGGAEPEGSRRPRGCGAGDRGPRPGPTPPSTTAGSRSATGPAAPQPAVRGGGGAPTLLQQAAGACRLGLRYVAGLRRELAERIEKERKLRRFDDVDDLQRRCGLRLDELERLAQAGALASLGLTRRGALWQAALAVRPAGELFERAGPENDPGRDAVEPSTAYPLPEMSAWESTVADFAATGVTAGKHPLAYFRTALTAQGVLSAAELVAVPHGARIRTAGSVIVRQRPGTAKGILFMTLEDETGMSQAIVHRALLREHRKTIVGSNGLVVEGLLEQRDGSISIKAERFWPLAELVAVPSHDFR